MLRQPQHRPCRSWPSCGVRTRNFRSRCVREVVAGGGFLITIAWRSDHEASAKLRSCCNCSTEIMSDARFPPHLMSALRITPHAENRV